MAHIYDSADQLIGKTPLLRLHHIEQDEGLFAKILAKLEYFNPTGSVKDRIAKSMLDDAEARGALQSGGTVIEPTSGNTGIGLAAVAAARGYRMILVMPDTMSVERRRLMRAYGAQIVLSDGKLGMKGAIAKAEELANEIPGSFLAGQFVNPANPAAHRASTGPEIFEDTGRQSRHLRRRRRHRRHDHRHGRISEIDRIRTSASLRPNLRPAPCFPGTRPARTRFRASVRASCRSVLDREVIDEIIPVSDDDAINTARAISRREGVLVGISSGAALHAAIEVARREENRGKTIVVLLPDSGDRYFSTALFEE